jgi:hypothetical protein
MNDDEILKIHLDRVDAVFAKIRECLADPNHLNLTSGEMTSLRKLFGETVADVFAAKNVIHNAKK